MTKQTKQYVVMGIIGVFVAGAVVWASHNVDAVEDLLK